MSTKAIFIVVLLFACNTVIGQNLTLFEAVDVPASAGAAGTAQARQQRNLSNAPAFTLLGTSRIGSRRRVSLIGSNGEVLVVELSGGDSTAIPGHSGYSIVSLSSGKVSIRQPDANACIAASDKGVVCRADGIAELSLTTAAPLVIAANQENGNGAPGQTESGDNGQPENPFAAALRAAAQNEANSQNGRPRRNSSERIEARRISPEDVPPGKRLVRTPFGDRIVDL